MEWYGLKNYKQIFENAYYHAMNRGRGRQTIFHGDDDYQNFLTYLEKHREEAIARFKLEVIAYCLMGNQHHLFVKTSLGNLTMRLNDLTMLPIINAGNNGNLIIVFVGNKKGYLLFKQAYEYTFKFCGEF